MRSINIPLAIVIISILGFLLIISQFSDRGNFTLTAREMHNKVISTDYLLQNEELMKLNNPILIDIRDRESFTLTGNENALNIPLSGILEEESLSQLRTDRAKVILAYDPVAANETWMLLTQMGYEKLYIISPELIK
jgi:rhodanese-related sulfurtransferase